MLFDDHGFGAWALSFWALGFSSVILLLTRLLDRRQRSKGVEITLINNRLGQIFVDVVKNLRLIRSYRAEGRMLSSVLSELQTRRAVDLSIRKIQATGQPIFTLLTGLFISGFLIYGATTTSEGDGLAWIGSLLIFILAMQRLMGPASQINTLMLRVVANWPAVEVFQAFLKKCRKTNKIAVTERWSALVTQ